MIEAAGHHTSTHTPAGSGRLWWFVAVSIAAHVGVLAVWRLELPRWSSSADMLNVTLIDAESGTAKRGTGPSPAPQDKAVAPQKVAHAPVVIAPKVDIKRTTKTPIEIPVDSNQSADIEMTTAPAQPQTVTSNDASINSSPPSQRPTAVPLSRDELLQRIKLQLDHFRRYPPIARRRGWEGDVHLTFRITEQGAINTIRVALSSGFKLLDDNAVAALKEIHDLLAGEEVIEQSQDLNVAVRYRLIDG